MTTIKRTAKDLVKENRRNVYIADLMPNNVPGLKSAYLETWNGDKIVFALIENPGPFRYQEIKGFIKLHSKYLIRAFNRATGQNCQHITVIFL